MENGVGRTVPVQHNPYTSKWNALFDKTFSQWISFKPKEGLKVYPCYACRDMFGSKNSFLDHVNRRGMLVKYKCPSCRHTELTFYNPCTLLLHTREHYTTNGGEIDLDNIKISVLPFGLAGFFQHPEIPIIFNVEENDAGDNLILNTRFYTPDCDSEGKKDVILRPVMLMFDQSQDKNIAPDRLVLKQISSNIPYCKFESFEKSSFLDNSIHSNNNLDVKEEIHEDYDTNIQIIEEASKLELSEDVIDQESRNYYPRCPECLMIQTDKMTEHFIDNNRPTNENLKCVVCKYIASTKCSLKAHERIHSGMDPFVCPECGRDFDNFQKLLDHLDDVCFHLSKHVRYRCPGRNCSKIFAASITFSTHFRIHMQLLIKCNECLLTFHTMNEFIEHSRLHPSKVVTPTKYYKCSVCKDSLVYTQGNYLEHVNKHCTDASQRVYVFTCKYCRNYFRSSQTYAIHLLKCSKKYEAAARESFRGNSQIMDETNTELEIIVKEPSSLNNNIQENVKKKIEKPSATVKCVLCNKDFSLQEIYEHIKSKVCQQVNNEREANTVNANSTGNPMVMCVICKEDFSVKEIKQHGKQCKLKHTKMLYSSSSEMSISSNNSKNETFSLDEDKKKKRKRVSTPQNKNKKILNTLNDTDIDILPEKPMIFDGTYYCNICNFNNIDRQIFHEHIVEHKDVSTSYQCMECGECFVVKPSLLKHLMYFHKIYDTDKYLEENECVDKIAVKELEQIIKMPKVNIESVGPNQCKICRLQFNDEFELKKHFRVHGMAFILKLND